MLINLIISFHFHSALLLYFFSHMITVYPVRLPQSWPIKFYYYIDVILYTRYGLTFSITDFFSTLSTTGVQMYPSLIYCNIQIVLYFFIKVYPCHSPIDV